MENKNIDLSVKMNIFAHTEASFRPSSSLYVVAIQKSKFGRLLSASRWVLCGRRSPRNHPSYQAQDV
jgi:hypothetical protein